MSEFDERKLGPATRVTPGSNTIHVGGDAAVECRRLEYYIAASRGGHRRGQTSRGSRGGQTYRGGLAGVRPRNKLFREGFRRVPGLDFQLCRCEAPRHESISKANRQARLSRPLIKPLIIRAMTSRCSFRAIDSGSLMRPRRRAISRRETHSCAEPRAIVKKLRRSGLVKRPLPSARLAAIERAARFNWSTRKP